MNVGRSLAAVANDEIYTGPDDAVAEIFTGAATLGYGQNLYYKPNHAARIIGLPEIEFQATISHGEKDMVVPVPTTYLGERPHYSSILTGLDPNQGYLKSAVIAIELGVLYEIANNNLNLSQEEKEQAIQDNVRAFLNQEKARMQEYIDNLQHENVTSFDEAGQIEILKETIARIESMISAPVIESVKTDTKEVLEESTQKNEEKQGVVGKVARAITDDLLGVIGFRKKAA